MVNKKVIGSLLLLLGTLGTQSLLSQKGLSQTSSTSLKEQYRSAVQNSALVEPGKNVDNLIEITPDNIMLVWNEDKTEILVVTWKSQSSYERFIKPSSNSPKDEDKLIWVTVAPQMKEFCQQYLKDHPHATEEELKLRLKQYLGLDPDWQYDVFVEMWVSPQDLFRPCVDPEINDRQCNLDFGSVTPKVTGITPDTGIKDYRLFYQYLYFKSIRHALQPWTGLGYTYDWSNPTSPVGASEFILVPGAAYRVNQAIPTLQYCQPSAS